MNQEKRFWVNTDVFPTEGALAYWNPQTDREECIVWEGPFKGWLFVETINDFWFKHHRYTESELAYLMTLVLQTTP